MVAISLKTEMLALAQIIMEISMKNLNKPEAISADELAEARIAIKIANTIEALANKH